jgi:hypothetical protein
VRRFLRTYYPEVLIIGAIFTILMIDLAPDFTFINKAADSVGYIYSAKYLYPSYHTSAPLYLLLSHVFLWIPFGTDAWRMGLLSVFSTTGACVFIYLIIRNLTQKRWLAILGTIAYGTSALVLSQSVIVNTYAFTTFLAIGAYYFATLKKWKLASLMLCFAIGVHLLGVIVWMLFFIFKDFRKNWKAIAISISGFLFYLYIPITSRPPYMWLPNPADTNIVSAVVGDTISVISMLVGNISIWALPKKIFDTIGLIGVSLGVVLAIPLIYYIKTIGKKILIQPIFWLAFVPIILFVGELDMNTFDYCMIGVPFLIIMACLGIKQITERYHVRAKVLVYASYVCIIGVGVFNGYYFDIGKVTDPNMSASKLYYEEFPKIPSDGIFMPNGGWNWEAIFLYNRENGKHIYPICIDILPNEIYREQLKKDGIKLEFDEEAGLSLAAMKTAQSIIELNDNVYTTVYTDVKTFGCVVVNANHDKSLVMPVDEALIKKNETNPDWQWIPDNPYEIMRTSLFMTKWGYAVVSPYYNFRTFMILFLLIYGSMIVVPKLFNRRKKKNENTIPKKEKEGSPTSSL